MLSRPDLVAKSRASLLTALVLGLLIAVFSVLQLTRGKGSKTFGCSVLSSTKLVEDQTTQNWLDFGILDDVYLLVDLLIVVTVFGLAYPIFRICFFRSVGICKHILLLQ